MKSVTSGDVSMTQEGSLTMKNPYMVPTNADRAFAPNGRYVNNEKT